MTICSENKQKLTWKLLKYPKTTQTRIVTPAWSSIWKAHVNTHISVVCSCKQMKHNCCIHYPFMSNTQRNARDWGQNVKKLQPPSSWHVWLRGNINTKSCCKCNCHKFPSPIHWLMCYGIYRLGWVKRKIISLKSDCQRTGRIKGVTYRGGQAGRNFAHFLCLDLWKIRRRFSCDDVSSTFQMRALHFNHEAGDMTCQLLAYI